MGIKKLILLFILIFIIIQLIRFIVPASITLSRYVYKVVRSAFLESKAFYFNSDKLSEDTAHFEANNWSGVDEYEITINLNSRKNNLEFATTDIDYKAKYTCRVYHADGTEYANSTNLIDCIVSKNVETDGYMYGTILQSANNKDYFNITVKPKINVTLDDDDYVFVTVEAESISPYKQTLRGEFKIIIGNMGMSYKIQDSNYSPYLEVIVTNTLNYYTVDTAFGAYAKDSTLTIYEYNGLSAEDKAKCHSMRITMSFNPNDVVMDTTTGMYLIAADNHQTTDTQKNSYTYINSITFDIDAEESKVVKFYKTDASQNYTYPFGTSTSIVAVSST